MKTILFNTQTEETVGGFREGNYNGIWNSALSKQPGWLPEHIIELTAVEADRPMYDPTMQRISSQWAANFQEKTFTRCWTIEDIPLAEIDYNNALKDWPHPQWAKRIVAPIDLAMVDVGAKMYVWFTINAFPIERSGENTIHLYCNVILPHHQTIVDNLGATVTIEDRPAILTPENIAEE
jgi:hypothetical protein